MGSVGDILVALAGVLVALLGPLEVGFAAVVVFWLLVPGTLVVPHLPHIVLADRAVLYCFAGRLLLRSGTPGEPRGRAYALTPLHATLALLLVVGFVVGVVVAPADASLAGDLHVWLSLLDLAVLLVVVLAVARTAGATTVARTVVAVAVVAAGIGVIERLTGWSWSHFFFEGLPIKYLAAGDGLLSTRGGAVRAQGAAQFALEYGWVMAVLFPVAVVTCVQWARGRRPVLQAVAVAAPLLIALASVMSGSRSADIVLPVSAVALLVLSRDRRVLGWVVGAALVSVVAVALHPSLVTKVFDIGALTDPASVRLDRLPPLFSLVTGRAYLGTGFVSAATSAFGGLDDAFAVLYATVGVVGLVAWCAVLASAVSGPARALRAPAGSEERLLGAACAVGTLALVVACAAYDVTQVVETPWLLVVLGALGTAAADVVPRQLPSWRQVVVRAALPLAGVIVGLAVLAAAPVSYGEGLSIFPVAPFVAAESSSPVDQFTGLTLASTVCAVVTDAAVVAPSTQVQCSEATNLFSYSVYPSLVVTTVRGPSPAAVRAEVKRAFTPIFDRMYLSGGVSSAMQHGKPAWATTAPLWVGAVGLGLALVGPVGIRRRRRSVEAER